MPEPLDDTELRLECLAMALGCAGPNPDLVLATAQPFADFVFGYDSDRFDDPDDRDDDPDPPCPQPVSGQDLTDAQRARISRIFELSGAP